MTNGIPETAGSFELVSGAQWDGVIHEPFPWGFILMAFCAMTLIALIFCFVRGLAFKKSRRSPELWRRRSTLLSITLLSVAGGISLIQMSCALLFAGSGQIADDRTCFIMAAFQIAQWLRLLAIAWMISGFGLAVSVMLRDCRKNITESPATPPAAQDP